jgi:hypothetical protein
LDFLHGSWIHMFTRSLQRVDQSIGSIYIGDIIFEFHIAIFSQGIAPSEVFIVFNTFLSNLVPT